MMNYVEESVKDGNQAETIAWRNDVGDLAAVSLIGRRGFFHRELQRGGIDLLQGEVFRVADVLFGNREASPAELGQCHVHGNFYLSGIEQIESPSWSGERGAHLGRLYFFDLHTRRQIFHADRNLVSHLDRSEERRVGKECRCRG